MIPADLSVETGKALLRPLNVTDYPAMLQLAQQDEDMWYYFSLNLADPLQLQRWFEIAFAEKQPIQDGHLLLLISKQDRLPAAAAWAIFRCMICGPRSAGAGWHRPFAARD